LWRVACGMVWVSVLTLHEGLRAAVLSVLKANGVSPLVEHGVYAQTLGPRFETVAEIKALARDSHIVGMTGAHEMTLAAELDLPYACIAMVDNFANGISKPLLAEEWRAGVHHNLKKMEAVLGSAARTRPALRCRVL
jgi:5'-methylthioinosine phosphorylase